MTHCPKCHKPILNGGLFTSAAKFKMRCPWCQATLQVDVQPKIVTRVAKLANGEPLTISQEQEWLPYEESTQPFSVSESPAGEIELNNRDDLEKLIQRAKDRGLKIVIQLQPDN